MKVKIGVKIYDAELQPVMIILNGNDKFNLAHMEDTAIKYAVFPEDWGTKEEMEQWMDEEIIAL